MTSSPLHPQANGEAEQAVQTAKNILKKNANPYLGLLAYRSAPLRNVLTPSEILINRKLKTKLPVLPDILQHKRLIENNLKKKSKNIETSMQEISMPVITFRNYLLFKKETKCIFATKRSTVTSRIDCQTQDHIEL